MVLFDVFMGILPCHGQGRGTRAKKSGDTGFDA